MPQTIQKEKFFDPRKPFQSQRPETHEEWQARMGGEVLAVVRSGLYLDFRFLDMALSALSPAPDERCRVLATDGQVLFYQPSHLLRLYQDNPKYLNRLYLHTIFHCVFRHLWLKGRREPQLWSLACDIAVENVIDSLNRTSVKRPLTYVRQNAYQQITAEETVVAAAPVYRWLTRQTPGVLRQLEREFVTDDHRLWPKDAPDQPQQMPTPLPQKTWQKIGERMQAELDLRDKEAGDGADALKQQVERLFNHLTDIDKSVSEQDIGKLFADAGQMRLGGDGTGNSRALDDVRTRIERNSLSRTVTTSLKTLLGIFTKEPYGFLPVDVEWLVARLFADGILTLTMNHEQLSLSSRNAQEFQRLFTRVESQERLLCDIRKHATDKQKRLVRDMMRDLFEKGVSSDDDEQLMADLKKECTDLREELRRQQATYREESYLPGKNTVDAGIALMTSLIDPTTTESFLSLIHI